MPELKVAAIPSSFVRRNMKLATDTGSGEGKLFVGSMAREAEFDLFFEFGGNYSYHVSKQNLIDYLLQVRFEYIFHKFNDYKNATPATWDTAYAIIQNLTDDDCNLILTKFIGDPRRYYICSDSPIFRNILREITVPKLTNYVFHKDEEDHNITLLLELNTEYGHETEAAVENEATEPDAARNILLYGVPGSGKSTEIKGIIGDDENHSERILFHPDYSYSDFVGQILPRTNEDGHISYPFFPGPFTRILKAAVNDPDHHPHYLVIEEINRGNAPAIFGDIFQLLDRRNGESEFGITNADIAKEVYGDATHKVKLPANLFIYATMNTADQNVFTLDTAFKRRWLMKNIPNDWISCLLRNVQIADTGITWESFARKINGIIIDTSAENLGTEDKRLGTYFVHANELATRDAFGEKVLMYLWDDVFKFDHTRIFKPQYRTLENLLAGFRSDGFSVFVDTIQFNGTPAETQGNEQAEAIPADIQDTDQNP